MIASSNELHYFLELAKTLNFSRAAERIGISQPSLSTAIKRLEQAIGAALFIRDKHKVTLTPAGKRLVLHATELQQLWDSTKAACLASHEEVQGNIILGCHPSIAMSFLPKFMPSLLNQYSHLELNLKHDLSRKILEGLMSLTIDIGIVVNPIKNPNLIIKKLFEDEFAFWQAKSSRFDLSLREEQVIICNPDLLQTQYLLKQLSKMGIKHYRLLQSSSLEVIAKLTAEGLGMGILPGLVVQSITPQVLKKIPKTPVYQDEICLVYRPENRNVRAIQVINEAIKSALNDA